MLSYTNEREKAISCQSIEYPRINTGRDSIEGDSN